MSADSRISDDRLTELLVDLSPNNVMRRKDLEGILSALTELRERRAQAVTPLEWRDGFAHTSFGLFYYIEDSGGGAGAVLERHEGSMVTKSTHHSASGAKAAAFTDYRNRVLSALAAPPPAQAAGVTEAQNGNRPLPFDRDTLGRFVREAWVRWAETQPPPKPNWLVPYDDLSEPDKEADRQIGEAVARWTIIGEAASLSAQDREE